MVVSHPPALGPAAETEVVAAAAPIEYTVAVERYLDQVGARRRVAPGIPDLPDRLDLAAGRQAGPVRRGAPR